MFIACLGNINDKSQGKAFRKLITRLSKEVWRHTVQNAAGHIPGIKKTSKYYMIACYPNTAFPSAYKEWDPMEKIPCDHTAMVEQANGKTLCVHTLGER